MLQGRTIFLGVTGGIAAYKAAELVRLLVRADALVRVGMTANAARFVTPLTFEALSGNPVISDMWGPGTDPMDHITRAQEPDLIVIAPATANFIAKMAHGIGDDFLSTLIIAATTRVLVCPAMNDKMYASPAVQDNLHALARRNVGVMAPDEGSLACRSQGPGRLPEPADILEEIRRMLSPQDLTGVEVLVTAGPTHEALDPVRFISNRSTGKMGYALAAAAHRRGASVTLISGPTHLTPPRGVRYQGVRTAQEMRDAVLEHRPRSRMVIKAAAVSDYRPRDWAPQKIKKGPESISLELLRNPDILAEVGCNKEGPPCILVGFAAETEDLLTHAQEKLKSKNLDLIVVNDVSRTDAGFGTDTNIVRIIRRDGRVEETPLLHKEAVADLVLDRAKELL